MASKHLMNYNIKMNFDFGKLARGKMSAHIDKFLGKNGKVFVRLTKDSLQSGKFRPLRESTLRSRRAGSKRFGNPTSKTQSTKPLNHTGALLKSIREKKISGDNVGMEMLQYGMLQHNGWRSKGRYTGFIEGRKFLPHKTKWDKNMEVDKLSPKMQKEYKKLKLVFTNQITKLMRTSMR